MLALVPLIAPGSTTSDTDWVNWGMGVISIPVEFITEAHIQSVLGAIVALGQIGGLIA